MDDATSKRRRKVLKLSGPEKYELQWRLMACYQATKRYENTIVQDLRPLWKKLPICALAAYDNPQMMENRRIDACERAAADEGEQRQADYQTYLRKVYDVVRKLRLVQKSEPARWAIDMVHANVVWGSLDRQGTGYSVRFPTDAVQLRCEISPAGASLRLARVPSIIEAYLNPEREGEEQHIASRELPAADVLSFDEWEAVERQAQELLAGWLAETRARWDKRYAHRYSATRDKWIADIPLLFRLLAPEPGDVPLTGREKERARRLAKVIGIDLPK